VGSLPPQEDGRAVSRLFSDYGSVLYAKIVVDPDLFRRDGGFGVVQMSTRREARAAIRALNNSEFHGRTLTVRGATAAEETAAGHPRMFESMNMGDEGEVTS
jgi:RNA recognition motif-containing protein